MAAGSCWRIYVVRFAFLQSHCSCSVETGQEGTGVPGGQPSIWECGAQAEMLERSRHSQGYVLLRFAKTRWFNHTQLRPLSLSILISPLVG